MANSLYQPYTVCVGVQGQDHQEIWRAGKMAHWLRVLVLTEDPGSIPRTFIAT